MTKLKRGPDFVPYPLGSLVLYKGVNFYIYRVSIYNGEYDLVSPKGGSRVYDIEHRQVTLLFPPVTTCDWEKMLEALSTS